MAAVLLAGACAQPPTVGAPARSPTPRASASPPVAPTVRTVPSTTPNVPDDARATAPSEPIDDTPREGWVIVERDAVLARQPIEDGAWEVVLLDMPAPDPAPEPEDEYALAPRHVALGLVPLSPDSDTSSPALPRARVVRTYQLDADAEWFDLHARRLSTDLHLYDLRINLHYGEDNWWTEVEATLWRIPALDIEPSALWSGHERYSGVLDICLTEDGIRYELERDEPDDRAARVVVVRTRSQTYEPHQPGDRERVPRRNCPPEAPQVTRTPVPLGPGTSTSP